MVIHEVDIPTERCRISPSFNSCIEDGFTIIVSDPLEMVIALLFELNTSRVGILAVLA
jgi:hypothetical protein